MSGKRVFYFASTLLVVVGILAGFIFLGNVMAYGNSIYNQLGVFSQVLGHISDNYVDEVDGEELIDGAITGMLEELDPHSNYLDADRFGRMQERNRGTYYGIGVSFDIVEGKLTVISPIEGSPSYKLGIRAGDVIAKIEGESAKGITREEVFDKLRGPRGTTVHVSVEREGHDELLEFDIVRDEIPILSVPYHFMLSDNIGYVRMNRFSATTSDELGEAIEDLKGKGMEQMILDLRGNSGGYLNEAIEVSDMFLTGDKRIVYTRGRLPDASEDYYTTGRGRFTEQPLIVMVDHGSASASEIVSGALQDWDRALIVGQTTFGKGLVQRQYKLKNGAALLLTVARYYTPSGRLIQRDYSDRDAYLSAETLDEIEANHEQAVADTTIEKFRTAGNRTVLGGGGIFPDVEVDLAYPNSEATTQLNADRAFFDFAPVYVSQNGLDAKEQDFDLFRRNFQLSDKDLSAFEKFLDSRELEYSADSLAVHRELVERSIKAEIARTLWGEPQRYQILIEADPELAEAMSLLPEAKLMARRVTDGEPGPVFDNN
ncbi:MAG: S41 family peptidase [Candidatus Eisenbacteria bacterium]|uniref:S41 family peptidase n=1 Tax=Eiseniibacteriota bacterium TaxID=2212470 RepID=A0A956NCF1_UNCEI|nr:S41 family peptidase [Candidatus Eisenbacteria bacterium]MCB9462764.1 S41 family peptidase [Candidatus Eisenbacteria bacterium]